MRSDLRGLLGPDRVLCRASDLVRYASDASPYRYLPRAVVMAHEAGDVAAVLAYGRAHRDPGDAARRRHQPQRPGADRRHPRRRPAPLVAGVEVSDDGRMARVRPGTVLGHANRVLARHGRKLGPDPASTDAATVGGVVANNSGGMRCGVARDSYSTVRAMKLVLASGTVIDTAAPGCGAASSPSAEPELAAGLAEIRDELRADAELSRARPAQVRDQEHDGLPPLRVPRRRRAAGDLPPARRRLGGHAGVHRRGRPSRPSRCRATRRSPGFTSPTSTRRPSAGARAWSPRARARSS